jgi:hypothetical protein
MYSRKLLMMGRGTARNDVEFLDKNKLGKLVRLVGFIKRKFVTMHGHMNEKTKGTATMESSNCFLIFSFVRLVSLMSFPPLHTTFFSSYLPLVLFCFLLPTILLMFLLSLL